MVRFRPPDYTSIGGDNFSEIETIKRLKITSNNEVTQSGLLHFSLRLPFHEDKRQYIESSLRCFIINRVLLGIISSSLVLKFIYVLRKSIYVGECFLSKFDDLDTLNENILAIISLEDTVRSEKYSKVRFDKTSHENLTLYLVDKRLELPLIDVYYNKDNTSFKINSDGESIGLPTPNSIFTIIPLATNYL